VTDIFSRQYRFRLQMRVAVTVVVVKGHQELRGSSSNEMLELIPYSPQPQRNSRSKRQRASQISCRTCTCFCEVLIYFRALVLRFSRREVEDHA